MHDGYALELGYAAPTVVTVVDYPDDLPLSGDRTGLAASLRTEPGFLN
jgi:hypothetical protein